jgi:hypothetical protein
MSYFVANLDDEGFDTGRQRPLSSATCICVCWLSWACIVSQEAGYCYRSGPPTAPATALHGFKAKSCLNCAAASLGNGVRTPVKPLLGFRTPVATRFGFKNPT